MEVVANKGSLKVAKNGGLVPLLGTNNKSAPKNRSHTIHETGIFYLDLFDLFGKCGKIIPCMGRIIMGSFYILTTQWGIHRYLHLGGWKTTQIPINHKWGIHLFPGVLLCIGACQDICQKHVHSTCVVF